MMADPVDRRQKDLERFKRRAFLLAGAQAAILIGLASRLTDLQVTNSSEYRLLAEKNRINYRIIPPQRGLIYDRNGAVLAENLRNYRILLVPEEANDVEAVLDNLGRILPISRYERQKKLEEISRQKGFVPVVVAEHANWEQVAAVSVNAPALPGISADLGNSRIYPFEDDFAHIVGYVGLVNENELDNPNDQDPVLQLPEFQIGKTGIEKSLDQELRGKAGTRKIEVNVHGRVMRELDRTVPHSGKDVQLTVDQRLQHYTLARLGKDAACAVIMDVWNGDLLVVASSPSFDPNKFSGGELSQAEFDELVSNPNRPLVSRTVQGSYPPASTFKMITALTALEEGLVGPEDIFECDGTYEASNRIFHCWSRQGHGSVNLFKSLGQSCDVYYYNLAQLAGIEKITAMGRRFGFGVRPGIPLPGAAQGLLPTKEWKRINRGSPWLAGDTLNAGIGQGFVLASAVQIAVMTARLATGLAIEPRLIRTTGNSMLEIGGISPVGVTEGNLNLVRSGMFAVVNEKKGTAYDSRSVSQESVFAGKTGTSQNRNITLAERRRGLKKNEDLPWNQRDHALFCGYIPYAEPRYAVAVIVEHGGGGSAVAAPIARDLLLRSYYGKLPPLEAYPEDIRPQVRREQQELDLRQPTRPESGSIRA